MCYCSDSQRFCPVSPRPPAAPCEIKLGVISNVASPYSDAYDGLEESAAQASSGRRLQGAVQLHAGSSCKPTDRQYNVDLIAGRPVGMPPPRLIEIVAAPSLQTAGGDTENTGADDAEPSPWAMWWF